MTFVRYNARKYCPLLLEISDTFLSQYRIHHRISNDYDRKKLSSSVSVEKESHKSKFLLSTFFCKLSPKHDMINKNNIKMSYWKLRNINDLCSNKTIEEILTTLFTGLMSLLPYSLQNSFFFIIWEDCFLFFNSLRLKQS